jgi:hypothetical protein
LVLLGVQICIYKWQYSNGWCKGHSCGRSLTFQVVRIPCHFPRFWMPLMCLHFHFRINANIQSPWNQTSISVVKSSQRSFCFANYQSSQWHDLPSKICHSPCIEKKELPFCESLSSLTTISPRKYENLHIPFIWFLFCKSNSCLSYSKPHVVKHFIDKRFNPLTSLKIITKNCLNILFKFSR